jgi:hypothetical protein
MSNRIFILNPSCWAALLVALVPSTSTYADVAAVTISGGTAVSNTTQTFSVGWEFTANSNIQITALGVYGDTSTLKQSHLVSIFREPNGGGNTLGAALVSGTVLSGTAVGSNGFAYTSTLSNSLTLIAGTTYLISADYTQSTTQDSYRQDATVSNNLPITPSPINNYFLFTGGNVSSSNKLNDIPLSTAHTLFGPNFTSVPEPSPVVLMGLTALVGGGFARWRSIRKRSREV